MSTVSKMISSLLFTAMLATACSDGSVSEPSTEAAPERFPESAAKPDTNSRTAQVPLGGPAQPEIPARETARVATNPEPAKFSEFMKRGRARFRGQDLEGALVDYRAAINSRPESQQAQIQTARTLLALGRGSEARSYAEAAIDADGTSSLAWNTMGRVELAEGDHDAALASFERATEEDVDNSYAWNNLGFVLMAEERYEDAVGALQEATSGIAPKAFMWNNLGMAFEHLDQIAMARAAYRQAGIDGSEKALANVERLKGVVSLVADGGYVDEGKEALELVHPRPSVEGDSDLVELAPDASMAGGEVQ